MKVTVEKPKIITLLYEQEKTDEDYGSCLWARFYLDLNNYTMSIESDCGNYTYGWPPTPKTEPFLHLLARMGTDYLLSKISNIRGSYAKELEPPVESVKRTFTFVEI